MALIIIGAFFIITGVRALMDITKPGALPVMLICFAVGGVLIYFGYKKIKNPPQIEDSASIPTTPIPVAPPSSASLGTYTFEPTGTRFECKFPAKTLRVRQRVLTKTKVHDPVSLQVYEWQGSPAVAVMNDRLGVDMGVIKKEQTGKVMNLIQNYRIIGEVKEITDFDYKGENYLSCEIQLEYFE